MAEPGVLPPPIDDGRVAQGLVRYVGRREGAMTFRGPSGRAYRFGRNPWHQLQRILAQDLEHFGRKVQFEVLPQGRTDPEQERRRREREAIREELLREITDLLPSPKPRSTTRRRPGRPKGRGFGALLDCLMTCGRLAEYFGGVEGAYDAIDRCVRAHPDRYPAAVPKSRYAHARSNAKASRRRTGQCLWYKHPEPYPK